VANFISSSGCGQLDLSISGGNGTGGGGNEINGFCDAAGEEIAAT